MSRTRTNVWCIQAVGRLRLPENLCGFRIPVVLRGFYGNALVHHCVSRAEQCETLVVNVSHNNPPALSFFASLGFAEYLAVKYLELPIM